MWPPQPPSFLSPPARPSMTNAFIIPSAVQCPNCLTFDTLTWQIISLFNNIYSSAEIACLLKPNTLSFVSSNFGQWLLRSYLYCSRALVRPFPILATFKYLQVRSTSYFPYWQVGRTTLSNLVRTSYQVWETGKRNSQKRFGEVRKVHLRKELLLLCKIWFFEGHINRSALSCRVGWSTGVSFGCFSNWISIWHLVFWSICIWWDPSCIAVSLEGAPTSGCIPEGSQGIGGHFLQCPLAFGNDAIRETYSCRNLNTGYQIQFQSKNLLSLYIREHICIAGPMGCSTTAA